MSNVKPLHQSPWLVEAIAQAEQFEDFLSAKRSAAIESLKQQSWPTRKTEAWKYTSLYPLSECEFAAPLERSITVENIQGVETLDIIFVDGVLQSLPQLPEGLVISAFSLADNAEQQNIVNLFSSVKPQKHLFGQLNDALCKDGVLIDVAAEAEITATIRVVYASSEGVESHARVLMQVGENAQVSIIEVNEAEHLSKSFHTAFSEYVVEDGAALTHYRFELQGNSAMSVGGCHFSLSNRSQLNSTLVGFGSELSRLDVDVIHDGQFANAKMNAIYLLDGEETFDLHTTIEHANANGTTEENVRGIVADRAKAVFNGRIHIHRDAQKTLAELNNRNLLMSRAAEINTKPELEIYADDVRCAHGATIAEIDQKAMYYLQSRGIDRATAQLMLNFGFINELVDQMPDQHLAQWLRPKLRERFLKMEVK